MAENAESIFGALQLAQDTKVFFKIKTPIIINNNQDIYDAPKHIHQRGAQCANGSKTSLKWRVFRRVFNLVLKLFIYQKCLH